MMGRHTRLGQMVAGEAPGMPAYPVYGLMVEFMAYSGLRASEVGLEVADVLFTPGAEVLSEGQRTKERKGGQWVTSTPKSK